MKRTAMLITLLAGLSSYAAILPHASSTQVTVHLLTEAHFNRNLYPDNGRWSDDRTWRDEQWKRQQWDRHQWQREQWERHQWQREQWERQREWRKYETRREWERRDNREIWNRFHRY